MDWALWSEMNNSEEKTPETLLFEQKRQVASQKDQTRHVDGEFLGKTLILNAHSVQPFKTG